jgi:hypothetical protein
MSARLVTQWLVFGYRLLVDGNASHGHLLSNCHRPDRQDRLSE